LYFSKFPYVDYTLNAKNDQTKTVFVRNILRRIGLSEELKTGRSVFIEYDIKDGERPEHIAERVYGDVDYHWLVLLTNEIVDPYHGWCKSGDVLQDYINKKYTGYAVYFTNRTIGSTSEWFYNSKVGQGSSLSQGSVKDSVVDYHPEFCKLIVSSPSFSTGNATITGNSGAVHAVYIHKIERNDLAVHKFQITRPVGSCGAVENVTVDPLSQQTNSYSFLGGFVGGKENVYPIVDSSGLCYDNTANGTVDLWETYIGKYMGICGPAVNIYNVSNTSHELTQNNSKRTIKILHPRYKRQALQELQTLLGL
jgi:hypothetical protein